MWYPGLTRPIGCKVHSSSGFKRQTIGSLGCSGCGRRELGGVNPSSFKEYGIWVTLVWLGLTQGG